MAECLLLANLDNQNFISHSSGNWNPSSRTQALTSMLASFSVTKIKYPDKEQVREERVCFISVSGSVHHGREAGRADT